MSDQNLHRELLGPAREEWAGFFKLDRWLPPTLACTLPLTLVIIEMSFAWITWTGKQEEKLIDYSAGQAAETLTLQPVQERSLSDDNRINIEDVMSYGPLVFGFSLTCVQYI